MSLSGSQPWSGLKWGSLERGFNRIRVRVIAAYTVETTKEILRNGYAPSLLTRESVMNGELWNISGPEGKLGAGGVPSRSDARARPGGETANLRVCAEYPAMGDMPTYP